MRLFVALDIPDAVREALAAVSRDLRKLGPEARWVRIQGAHITLKFVGYTQPEQSERIRAALADVRAAGPIEMQFTGLGFFPSARRPRVLWAGVAGGPELRALAATIEAQLEPLGIPRETREFNPHITLARFDSPKGLEALRTEVETLSARDFGRDTAREFHLYRSVLKRGGAEYTRLASYPIAGSRVLES